MAFKALIVCLASGWRPWHLWKPRQQPAVTKWDWDTIGGPDKVSPICYQMSLTFGRVA